MKTMPPDVISHENQLQHLSEPSIFMLDVFRTADHAGQFFIPHRCRCSNTSRPKSEQQAHLRLNLYLMTTHLCLMTTPTLILTQNDGMGQELQVMSVSYQILPNDSWD